MSLKTNNYFNESLILAQDERWRLMPAMQVERWRLRLLPAELEMQAGDGTRR